MEKCICTLQFNENNISLLCTDCGITRCKTCWEDLKKYGSNESNNLNSICPECYSCIKPVISFSLISKDDYDCPICICDMKYCAIVLNCGHAFCTKCYTHILKKETNNLQIKCVYDVISSLTKLPIIKKCALCNQRPKYHYSRNYIDMDVLSYSHPQTIKIWVWNMYDIYIDLLKQQFISPTHIRLAIKEYKKFMILKYLTKDYDSVVLSPPPMIDIVWHAHILNTKNYYNFSRCFDNFVHHTPLNAFDDDKIIRRNNTLSEYIKHFGFTATIGYWSIKGNSRVNADEVTFNIEIKHNNTILQMNGCYNNMYIWEILLFLREELNVNPENLNIISGNSILNTFKRFKDYNIIQSSKVETLLKLRGC